MIPVMRDLVSDFRQGVERDGREDCHDAEEEGMGEGDKQGFSVVTHWKVGELAREGSLRWIGERRVGETGCSMFSGEITSAVDLQPEVLVLCQSLLPGVLSQSDVDTVEPQPYPADLATDFHSAVCKLFFCSNAYAVCHTHAERHCVLNLGRNT